MKKYKIGLDIDGVLADFNMAWHILYPDVDPRPTMWCFDDRIDERFDKMEKENTLDDFYLNIGRLIEPEDILIEIDCYITSRPVSSEVSQMWLKKNGFPEKPVFSVGLENSKVGVAKKCKLDFFVDDKFENFVELNENGITTYLFDASWNRKYDVGHQRVYDLNLPILSQ